MKRRKKPDISEDVIGVNPFTKTLVVKVRKTETGGYAENGMPIEVDLDGDPYYKTFFGRDIRILRSKLKFRAIQLLDWIMQSIESGEDVIWIDAPRYMRECDIKDDKTYRAAVTELWTAGFIAPCPKVKHAYFINPEYGFKGSRVNKYKNNIQYVP